MQSCAPISAFARQRATLLAVVVTVLAILSASLGIGPLASLPSHYNAKKVKRPKGLKPASAFDDGSPHVAGVYVYYKRPKAFMHSITAYRAAYPTANLFMLCDEGCYNFSGAALRFNAHYDGLEHQIVVKNVHSAFYIGPAQAKTFLSVYRNAVNAMTEPWFIQLEDDVFVMKRIQSKLEHAINGWAPEKRLIGQAADYVRERNPDAPKELVLGGFGGSVYNTAFWRAVLNRDDIDAEVDALYGHGKERAYGIDYIMASLCYRFKGTLGTFDGYVESFEDRYQSMNEAGIIEVLHGYKSLYQNHPLTWDEKMTLGQPFEDSLRREQGG